MSDLHNTLPSETILQQPLAPVAKTKMISNKLRLFIILSAGVHIGFLVCWGVPAYIKHIAEVAAIEAEKQQKLALNEAKIKGKEETKAQNQAEVKKKVEELIKEDFDKIVLGDLNKKEKKELWNDVIEKLEPKLEAYKNELLDPSISPAKIEADLLDLKSDMVTELDKTLKADAAKDMKDDFLAAIDDKIAPMLAEDYRKNIEKTVGVPLQQEGAKIVADEKNLIDRDRAEIKGALEGAIKDVDQAKNDLTGAKDRIQKAKDAKALADKAAGEASSNQVKGESKNIDATAAQVKSAVENLIKAGEKTGDAGLKEKIESIVKNEGNQASKDTADAKASAEKGDGKNTRSQTAAAGDSVKKLGDAISKVKGAMDASSGDAKGKQAAKADLENAGKQTDAASAGLKGVKDRLDRSDATSTASSKVRDQQTDNAIKGEAGSVAKAEGALKSASAKFGKAAERAGSFSDDLKTTISEVAGGKVDTAQSKVGAVGQAIKDSKEGQKNTDGTVTTSTSSTADTVTDPNVKKNGSDTATTNTASANSATTKEGDKNRDQKEGDRKSGKSDGVESALNDAIHATQQLTDAANSARDASAKAQFDPTAQARSVLNTMRNGEIKHVMSSSFDKNFSDNTAPRLAEKLGAVFEKTLESEGIQDSDAVAEVRSKIQGILKNKVPRLTRAGEASTDPLSKSENLGEAKDSDNKNSTRSKAITDRVKKAVDNLANKSLASVTNDTKEDDLAVTAAGSALAAAVKVPRTYSSDPNRVGKNLHAHMGGNAKPHAQTETGDVDLSQDSSANPSGGDESGADRGASKAHKPHGKLGNGPHNPNAVKSKNPDYFYDGEPGVEQAGGDPNDDGRGHANEGGSQSTGKGQSKGAGDKRGLRARVANLSKNVKAGRMGMLEDNNGADGETGAAGEDGKKNNSKKDGKDGGKGDGDGTEGAQSGVSGIASIRQKALKKGLAERGSGGGTGRSSYLYNKSEHAKMAAEIQTRDKSVAQGEVWERKGAEGAVSTAEENTDRLKYGVILVPKPITGEIVGVAEEKEAFKPAFATKSFASIPYLREPIILNGESNQWKDIPAFFAKPEWDGAPNPALKFAQSQPIKMAWDNTGLYFVWDIKDADGSTSQVGVSNFWEGDGVEIFFDARNSKDSKRGGAGTQQFWIWPRGTKTEAGIVGGEAIFGEKVETKYKTFTKDDIQRFYKRTTDGWLMQAHIPFERIRNFKALPGRIVGLNFLINTGTKLGYFWAGNSAVQTSQHPDTWGDALLAGCDGKLEVVDKLTAELKTGETVKALQTLNVGEPLRIRITDADMNLADARRDKISVTLKAKGSGEVRIVTLEETGEKTGIFEGALRTGWNLGELNDKTLPLFEGEKIGVVYLDQARSNGTRNVEVKFTVKTIAGVLDLASTK